MRSKISILKSSYYDHLKAGKGILRSMRIDTSAVADIVPVDFPVNMMISVAWYTVLTKPKETLIYHCTTGNVNPCTWGEMGMSATLMLLFFFKYTCSFWSSFQTASGWLTVVVCPGFTPRLGHTKDYYKMLQTASLLGIQVLRQKLGSAA